MAEKSDKHGPKLDEEMQRESEGLTRTGSSTHPQPWNDPEPVDTDSGLDPTAHLTDRRGAPPGMTPQDVEARSEVASVLAGVQYPAPPRELAAHAAPSGGAGGRRRITRRGPTTRPGSRTLSSPKPVSTSTNPVLVSMSRQWSTMPMAMVPQLR